MLGVLKRRWKPKRASSANNRISADSCPAGIETVVTEKAPSRIAPSVRQVHPLCEDKAQLLAYDKRASLDSNPGVLSPAYPLAPNICVEGGRIEFIKHSPDGESVAPTPPATPRIGGRITVTRSQQTSDLDDEETEKFDCVKESLESRVTELEQALEAAQKAELRDKQTLQKLQRQLARRESAQRDAERERRLRVDSELRARKALQEAARCRSRLHLLTGEFSRMEESVRAMLVYKSRAEQLRQEKSALTVAFESRCQQYQCTIGRLNQEVTSLRQQLQQVGSEPALREGALQAHTAALHRHAEESRRQYERCLDDVANQVVRALLAQKNLREEITCLTHRIKDLESQNRTLTTLLVQQLRGDSPSLSDIEISISKHLALEDTPEDRTKLDSDSPIEVSPSNSTLMKTSLRLKHCNSFNSDCLDASTSPNQSEKQDDVAPRLLEKRLSADFTVLDTRLSLEDKKRHQVLAKLWTELKGTEVTPQRLLEALSAVDSSLWVPPKRPVSLNLQLPILQAAKYRAKPILAQTSSKSEEETGNESPESGNRDEGYSTMSSDVQGEVTRSTEPTRGLEDLKEASDETDFADNRLLVVEDKDPDILYIPLNFSFGLNPRNSYPPSKNILPFQHIMRSFSDSHLCLKITTAPSPCYSLSSPISSSPSILLLDITDKKINPLRRTKATTSLLPAGEFDNHSPISWSSGHDDRIECSNWDAEYVQHWLKLDETRLALQQQHRDLLELEYDRAELEDWSLSLSTEDIREAAWRKAEAMTPGQISLSTLPSIQENNPLELEEDANECLWNNSSYMMDREGGEIVALLMDAPMNTHIEKQWPYALNGNNSTSPGDSWSSTGTHSEDCCHSYERETYSKRSSVALSDDAGEIPVIGTDFTRDFYRLVKFESTKSLASTSSRSAGCAYSENGDREQALQNVLTFIAEQQMYCHVREERDSRPNSVIEDITKDFNIEGPPQHIEDVKMCEDCEIFNNSADKTINSSENYVNLKQLREEFVLNEQNTVKDSETVEECLINSVAYADEVCIVTPLTIQDSDGVTEQPAVNMEVKSAMTDSIISRIPRRQKSNTPTPTSTPKASPSKIPSLISKRSLKSKIPASKKNPQPVITSERLPSCPSGLVNSIIDGPPHRAVSFHERATSKDVIDELNRMIRKGEDGHEVLECEPSAEPLDEACRPTGWVHIEKDVDLTDPKLRANLLDVMLASQSSDSSPTSSCGGSVTSDSTEETPDYGQLHRIHRFHRQKKACAVRKELAAVVRVNLPSASRPSIMGRTDFFVRYGDKEKEAVASFDFLEELSTTSSSFSCSVEDDEQVID